MYLSFSLRFSRCPLLSLLFIEPETGVLQICLKPVFDMGTSSSSLPVA